MSNEKREYNPYWETEVTGEEKEFLNHVITNHRIKYDIPYSELAWLKAACVNELRTRRSQRKVSDLTDELERAREEMEVHMNEQERFEKRFRLREQPINARERVDVIDVGGYPF